VRTGKLSSPGDEGEHMDERVKRLKTPEECEGFIKNVQLKHPDLAQQARRRKVELLASAYGGAMNEAEIDLDYAPGIDGN